MSPQNWPTRSALASELHQLAGAQPFHHPSENQAFWDLNNSREPQDILDILDILVILHLLELFIAGKLQGCGGNSTDLKRS